MDPRTSCINLLGLPNEILLRIIEQETLVKIPKTYLVLQDCLGESQNKAEVLYFHRR